MSRTLPKLENTLEILFFGDIVGRPGRTVVKHYLGSLPVNQRPDLIIANVENASHGFGFSQTQYQELTNTGIQAFTSGNHIWDRKDIFDYIHTADGLIRPHNFPHNSPGVGYRIITVNSPRLAAPVQVGVINLIGQVFMGSYNSPWESIDACVAAIKPITPIMFLDMHAEATAEKVCMAHYAASLGVSAMVGTHTHVQTADDRILADQMGALTDAGFNGAYHSVIGMDAELSLKRLKTMLPVKLDVASSSMLQLNGVRYWVDLNSGVCKHIERLNSIMDTNIMLTTGSVPDAFSYSSGG